MLPVRRQGCLRGPAGELPPHGTGGRKETGRVTGRWGGRVLRGRTAAPSGSLCPGVAAHRGPGPVQASGPSRHAGTFPPPPPQGGPAELGNRRRFWLPRPQITGSPGRASAAAALSPASPSEGPHQGQPTPPPPPHRGAAPGSARPARPGPARSPRRRRRRRSPRPPRARAAHQGSRAYSSIFAGATAFARLPPPPDWLAAPRRRPMGTEGGTRRWGGRACAQLSARAPWLLGPAPPGAEWRRFCGAAVPGQGPPRLLGPAAPLLPSSGTAGCAGPWGGGEGWLWVPSEGWLWVPRGSGSGG